MPTDEQKDPDELADENVAFSATELDDIVNSAEITEQEMSSDEDLEEYLDNHGVTAIDEGLRILLAITNGLLEVPEIVHRDLKPKNVLRHEDTWKIADFGIARFVEELHY